MEVLSRTKSLFFYTFLYRKTKLKICGVSFPNMVFNIIYALPMSINSALMLLNVYLSFNSGAAFKTISSSIYLGMGTVSAVCIYMCFAFKMKSFIALIDQIQIIVHKRMFENNLFPLIPYIDQVIYFRSKKIIKSNGNLQGFERANSRFCAQNRYFRSLC